MLLGEAVSPGLAQGRALLCNCAIRPVVPIRQLSEDDEAQRELARFDEAVAAVGETLARVEADVRLSSLDIRAQVEQDWKRRHPIDTPEPSAPL